MTGMLSSKRGMSPLIATILLIAFAVALGVVVMRLPETFQMPSGFSVVDNKACFRAADGQSVIQIDIKNGNTMDIKDFIINIKGSNKMVDVATILTTTLEKSYSTQLLIPYDPATVGDIQKIYLNPIVVKNGMESREPFVEITNIVPC